MTRPETQASDLLLHPAVIGALAIWVINDHVLKQAYPSWWTGKLSDAAGLVVFPCFLVMVFERVPRVRRALTAQQQLWLASAVTMLALSAVKLWPPAAWAYQWGLGLAQWPWHALHHALNDHQPPVLAKVALAMDPTDLWTLPFACLPVWLLRGDLNRTCLDRIPRLRTIHALSHKTETGSRRVCR